MPRKKSVSAESVPEETEVLKAIDCKEEILEESQETEVLQLESDTTQKQPAVNKDAETLDENGDQDASTNVFKAQSCLSEESGTWRADDVGADVTTSEPVSQSQANMSSLDSSSPFLGNVERGREQDGQGTEQLPIEESVIASEELMQRAQSARAKAREEFFDLDIKKLDRDLSPLQKREWTDIYSSFRAGTPLSGVIAGKEEINLTVANAETGKPERINVLCFTVINYRVKILIPETELWSGGRVLKRYVTSHMVGANIRYVITSIDREGECAIASRRLAMEQKRYAFAHARTGNKEGDIVQCNVLVVGPKLVLLECGGYDLVLRPVDLTYVSMVDFRDEYKSGQVLDAVIKEYSPEEEKIRVSVKEVNPNPFDGADARHPVGSDRQALVTNRYRGGVFCRLTDGTTCMCLFGRGYTEYDCSPNDRVIVRITRYDYTLKQIYGRILARW